MGRAAFFIRTFGCPMHCPWCDSAGTWHPDYVPKTINRMSVADLVKEAADSRAAFVVVTGGEPAIHDLTELTTALNAVGMPVHLETSGAFPIKGTFDWITVSPKNKWAKPMLSENIVKADEFKFIIEHPDDIPAFAGLIYKRSWPPTPLRPIWLHPEWSKRNDVRGVLDAITQYVKLFGDPFRVGYQLHKIFKADALDNRAAQLAPLGGDPARSSLLCWASR